MLNAYILSLYIENTFLNHFFILNIDNDSNEMFFFLDLKNVKNKYSL